MRWSCAPRARSFPTILVALTPTIDLALPGWSTPLQILGKEAVESASKSDILLRHVRGLRNRELEDVAASIKEVLDWIKEDK